MVSYNKEDKQVIDVPCSCWDSRSPCPRCPSPLRSSSSRCGSRTRCLAGSVEETDTLGAVDDFHMSQDTEGQKHLEC